MTVGYAQKGSTSFIFLVYLIFNTTISEALVFERVLIGEQKLAKQRLQKNVLQRLFELE